MKKLTIDLTDIAIHTRRSWGMVKPTTKAFKSKRDYNRKDKSWKRDQD